MVPLTPCQISLRWRACYVLEYNTAGQVYSCSVSLSHINRIHPDYKWSRYWTSDQSKIQDTGLGVRKGCKHCLNSVKCMIKLLDWKGGILYARLGGATSIWDEVFHWVWDQIMLLKLGVYMLAWVYYLKDRGASTMSSVQSNCEIKIEVIYGYPYSRLGVRVRQGCKQPLNQLTPAVLNPLHRAASSNQHASHLTV